MAVILFRTASALAFACVGAQAAFAASKGEPCPVCGVFAFAALGALLGRFADELERVSD